MVEKPKSRLFVSAWPRKSRILSVASKLNLEHYSYEIRSWSDFAGNVKSLEIKKNCYSLIKFSKTSI